MDFLFPIGMIISGFAVLVFGGDSLVKAAVSISAKLNLSPAVIGLTIIAAGTSAPEAVTSLFAAMREAPDVALGNVIGSNIFNILGILGIASLIHSIKVEKSLVMIEIPMLIICSLFMIGMCEDLRLDKMEGGLFLLVLLVLIFFSINRAKKIGYEPGEEIERLPNAYWDIGYLIVGIGALVGGGYLALEGGISLGQIAGLSERVIGITIISVGTGLPELATSAVAAYRRQNDIAVANVIGSNLMNTMGVTGLASFVHPINVSKELLVKDSYVMLAITVLLIPLIVLGRYYINRAMGLILLLGYVGYIISLL